jgi:hypothetical protein
MVDGAVASRMTGVTGSTLGGSSSISHNGGLSSGDSTTLRDIYDDRITSSAIAPGMVVAKRIYSKNASGQKDTLQKIYIMFKQPSGYYPEGGDWEYAEIPANSSTNYTTNPNGLLSGAAQRGKLSTCASCHKNAAGNDFLFYR